MKNCYLCHHPLIGNAEAGDVRIVLYSRDMHQTLNERTEWAHRKCLEAAARLLEQHNEAAA